LGRRRRVLRLVGRVPDGTSGADDER
jgi:hypothetical protein